MKFSRLKRIASRGFTLVEVIVTIIVMGILAAYFIHFMGAAVDNSWKSVELVAGEAEAEAKMEQIIAYYTSKINQDLENALKSIEDKYESDDQTTMQYVVFEPSDKATPVGASNNLQVTVEAPGNNLTTILTKSRTSSSDPKVDY
jgi:prepilin-type N-terminal cleavage/methylation domain-containing protein